MPYRPDIDGLRTLAVGLVVIFHVGFQDLSGGFIGVDVFFVISGFLITGLIVKEIRSGTFTFANFYMRRLRRLAPSLLVVLFATLVIGYFILSPELYEELGYSTIATILSVSNILFWTLSGYFDTDAIYKPLLHTWSLAVEEQFYIIWPVLLLATMSWFGGARRIAFVAVALGLVSLIAAQMLLPYDPSAVFYLTPLRLYEFSCGAVVAVLPNLIGRNAAVHHAASVTGLVMILRAALVLDDESAFPGFLALVPCVGTALIIAAGPNAIVNRALALSPIQYLGRTSYSVYLAHWPLVVYYFYKNGTITPEWVKLLLLLASFALGALLYHLVEQPFRVRKAGHFLISGRRLIWASGCSAVFLAVFAGNIVQRHGYDWRVSDGMRALVAEIGDAGGARGSAIRMGSCHRGRQNDKRFLAAFKSCVPENIKNAIVVLGDSHAADIWAATASEFPSRQVIQLTGAGCSLGRSLVGKDCERFYNFAQDWIEAHRDEISAIIYTQRGASLFADNIQKTLDPAVSPDSIGLLVAGLSRFSDMGIPLIVIGPRSEFRPTIQVVATTSLDMTEFDDRMMIAERTVLRKLDDAIPDAFEGTSIQYFSTFKAVCGKEACPYIMPDGRPLIVDHSHYSPSGGRYVVRQLSGAYPQLALVLE